MYKLKDFAQDISVAIKDAQSSPFDRFVGLEHYDSGEPVITRYTDKSLLSSSVKEFRKNDILIARRNVYLKRAGIAFFDGLTSGDSIVLRIYDDCESRTGISKQDAIRIIPFILNSNVFWAYANKHADGMNSKRISKEMLYDYEFDLPPLAEQKVLAEKLWAAYRLKESYKKLLAATEEMVKSQFIEMFKDKQTDGKIADLVDTDIKSVKKSFNKDDSIEYIDISSVNAKSRTLNETTQYIVSSAPSRAQQCVQNGDILVSTVRPINRNVAVVDRDLTNLVASTGFCVLRPKDGYREYLLAIVTSNKYTDKMCDIASGGLYPAVNNSDVLSYDIFIPDKDFLNRVTQIYRQADKSGFELRKSIDAIDVVIKSLINS